MNLRSILAYIGRKVPIYLGISICVIFLLFLVTTLLLHFTSLKGLIIYWTALAILFGILCLIKKWNDWGMRVEEEETRGRVQGIQAVQAIQAYPIQEEREAIEAIERIEAIEAAERDLFLEIANAPTNVPEETIETTETIKTIETKVKEPKEPKEPKEEVIKKEEITNALERIEVD